MRFRIVTVLVVVIIIVDPFPGISRHNTTWTSSAVKIPLWNHPGGKPKRCLLDPSLNFWRGMRAPSQGENGRDGARELDVRKGSN